MHLQLPEYHFHRGLTRNEWLWTLLLLGVIVLTIVSTLHSEVERGHARMATDELSYLSSQIYLALEQREEATAADLPLPLLGPGMPPAGLATSGAAPQLLRDFLLEDCYLPVDPWGHGYVLMLGKAEGQIAAFVVSGGQQGVLPTAIDLHTPFTHRIHWPPR